MWTKTYSKTYQGITKETIWRLWADVANWPRWDKELEYCSIEGEFKAGNHIFLKPKNGPKVKLILSEIIPNAQFTDYCQFFGATMSDFHQLEDTQEGIRITNTVTVTGWLSIIWTNLVAKNVFHSIPRQMDALVNLARTV